MTASAAQEIPAQPATDDRGVVFARERLLRHPLYRAVDTVPRLRVFMEDHVFAVWDFMSIAKRLQRDLTCVSLPWIPPAAPGLARFVNDIILSEESDEGPRGYAASHLEIYLDAMREIGADRGPFDAFLTALKAGASPDAALATAGAPGHVRRFVLRTLAVATAGTTIEVAADFFHSREDVIPAMFTRLLSRWDDPAAQVPTFKFYLERHIELDGDDHGPAARQMLEHLAEGRAENRERAWDAARAGLEARIALWDGCFERLQASPGG